ncbi:hypothetical protein A2533_00790 [Candidatus Falkowbacteria bacterium RIFOXYD2_FULL_35_9]|nr:MAG: hypothetical protein A2533_00790 [Candidatus Falkowbacteria bacterium RIFOXYD2_FULL_35_9]
MLYQYFVQINLNPIVRVNSLGCPVCRNEYLKALTGFIKSKRSAVCTDCRSNAGRDPIKFLQCASQKCQKVYEDAPQVVDYLCENCHNHLFKFLESLDEVGVSYVLDSRFISDFAYYNSTIYSIVSQLPISKETVEADVEVEVEVEKDNKEATAEEGDFVLAEGGRMNYLCEMLSGPEVPVAGIKLFVEKLISEIKRRKVELAPVRAPHVYLAQISEQAKRKAMSFLDELRREDLRVVANFSKDNLKSQLDTATKKGAKIILILGQREVVDGTILMRDVESGIQEVVSQKKIIEEVKKRLAEKQLKNR